MDIETLPTTEQMPEQPIEAEVYYGGGFLKVIGSDGAGLVGGYLVPFYGEDAHGEHFTPNTDLCLNWYPEYPVIFHHGLNDQAQTEKIGKTIKLVTDTNGVWVEAQLDMDNPYARRVYDMIRSGKIGWSSGSLPHLVQKNPDGEILRWPLIEATLTPSPAAGKRTAVAALKFDISALDSVSVLDEPKEPTAKGVDEHIDATKSANVTTSEETNSAKETKNMDGMTLEQFLQAAQAAGVVVTEEQLQQIQQSVPANTDEPAIMADTEEEEKPEEMKTDAVEEKDEDKPVTVKMFRQILAQQTVFNQRTATGKSKVPARTGGTKSAPAVIKPRSKYADMSYQDMAFHHSVMQAANSRQGGWRPDKDFMQELAVKAIDAHAKGDATFEPKAVKALMAIKADELNYSTQASYGDEFVPEYWRDQLWRKPRIDNVVTNNTTFIPMPSNPYKLPIESTDPTVHAVAETKNENQLTLADSNSPIPDSKIGTSNGTMTAAKLALRVGVAEELNEDSIIPVASLWREQSVRAMEDARDNVLLNADATTGTTNINNNGGAIGSTNKVLYGGGDGFFHLPLVDATTLAKDMGNAAPTLLAIRETRAKLGRAMIGDLSNLVIYVDPLTYVKLLQVDELNVFMNNGQYATVNTGEVGRIDNIPVFISNEIAQSASNGMVSSTAADNTRGRLLIVHKPSWIAGYRRDIKVNFDYVAAYDAWQLVVSMRMALVRRSTDCAALLYNIAV